MSNIDTFDIAEGIKILRRNIFIFGLSLFICAAVSLAIAYSLKKQFKSKAILNIQSSYFQNPLINDLITEVNDPQELQSQRTSLLRLALSNSFLDSLAAKYNIYTEKARQGELALTRERDLFLNTIQYYSLSPTTFEITVTAEQPTVAQKMTDAVLEKNEDDSL